MSIVPIDFLAR